LHPASAKKPHLDDIDTGRGDFCSGICQQLRLHGQIAYGRTRDASPADRPDDLDNLMQRQTPKRAFCRVLQIQDIDTCPKGDLRFGSAANADQ
jgi:hypothetical protein